MPGAPVPSEPARPRGASDFLSPAGLRAGMATARRLAGPGARVELARIAATQLQVIAHDGRRRRIVLVSGGFTRAIETSTGARSGREFRFGALDPRALRRLLPTLDRRHGVTKGEVDYVVVIRDPIERDLEWLVYPRGGGRHFQADARGGSVRRVG